MLLTLACLIGLSIAGQDGPPVPTASSRPAWACEGETPWSSPLDEVGEGDGDEADEATPLDDEVEDLPVEPEGEDEEDPGEAMGTKGRSTAAVLFMPLGWIVPIEVPPPLLSRADATARPKGYPLSLLCRLRF